MRADRLKKAIETLRDISARQLPWNMAEWFASPKWDDCGTAACALGWICRQEWAQKAGLRGDITGMPIYGDGAYGVDAGAEFFEIDYDEANWLFMPSQYGEWVVSGGGREVWYSKRATPDMVADRMERILAGGGIVHMHSGEQL